MPAPAPRLRAKAHAVRRTAGRRVAAAVRVGWRITLLAAVAAGAFAASFALRIALWRIFFHP